MVLVKVTAKADCTFGSPFTREYIYIYIHSFLAGDSGVVFSVSPSVSTRNFGAPLLCSLLTVVGATLVVK